MANLVGSRGYNSRAYISPAPGAFAVIGSTDFGASAPATPSLAYNAGAGSLAMSTANVKLTWITAEGESLPSGNATVAVSAATGAVTVTIPAVPTTGAKVLGFRVYSASTAATLLNVSALSTTQVQQNFVTNQGVLSGFPIADATVQILIYGAGAAVPTVDNSGIQPALPLVGASGSGTASVDYFAVVPNTGSQWKTQKSVEYMRSDGVADPEGIILQKIDCIAPTYAQLGGTNGQGATVALGAVMVINGYAFVATVGGTTAATFIGFSKFNLTKGATTTDNSVTWTSQGKAAFLRFRFANVSGTAATPVAQAYEIFQN